MRAVPLALLLLAGACSGDDDPSEAPDAGGPETVADAGPDAMRSGAHVLVTTTYCPWDLQIVDGVAYWREDDSYAESRIYRASLDGGEPELLWVGPASAGAGFQVGDGALYWQGNEWPVRLDLATGLAAPLIKQPTSFVRVVDHARVFVFMAAQTTHEGLEVAEIHADGELSTIARWEEYGHHAARAYAGPGQLYWKLQQPDYPPSLYLLDVVGGGWNFYAFDGDIRAAASDGVRRYALLDEGSETVVSIGGGLSEVQRYAVPRAADAVAPDGADPWAAWILVGGSLHHATASDVSEPLLRRIAALASESDAVVVAQCEKAAAPRLVRWYP
jgi:hypothetical protein